MLVKLIIYYYFRCFLTPNIDTFLGVSSKAAFLKNLNKNLILSPIQLFHFSAVKLGKFIEDILQVFMKTNLIIDTKHSRRDSSKKLSLFTSWKNVFKIFISIVVFGVLGSKKKFCFILFCRCFLLITTKIFPFIAQIRLHLF